MDGMFLVGPVIPISRGVIGCPGNGWTRQNLNRLHVVVNGWTVSQLPRSVHKGLRVFHGLLKMYPNDDLLLPGWETIIDCDVVSLFSCVWCVNPMLGKLFREIVLMEETSKSYLHQLIGGCSHFTFFSNIPSWLWDRFLLHKRYVPNVGECHGQTK